ncbi:MAG: helix-turn-helix transcriptional regulator [Bacteroidia bacterium]|nr:helix-turn-helix transcriptional regulator [Bacteroidia bacterium]
MDEINKRVVQFYEQTGLSKSEFSSALGVSPSIMSHVSSGRNKVGVELIQKILGAYPTVSAQWLLTGTGSMFEAENGHKIKALEAEVNDLRTELREILAKLTVFTRRFEQVDRYLQ